MDPIRTPAKTFRDLNVWRKAHEFVLGVYGFTAGFPKQETYALSIQMRRAAVSIPANIAEGFRKRGRPDKIRFMNTAEGSVEECRYYLILAPDLGYGNTDQLMRLLEEVSRLLNAYAKAIQEGTSRSQETGDRSQNPKVANVRDQEGKIRIQPAVGLRSRVAPDAILTPDS